LFGRGLVPREIAMARQIKRFYFLQKICFFYKYFSTNGKSFKRSEHQSEIHLYLETCGLYTFELPILLFVAGFANKLPFFMLIALQAY
jgi:hypothetical protein